MEGQEAEPPCIGYYPILGRDTHCVMPGWIISAKMKLIFALCITFAAIGYSFAIYKVINRYWYDLRPKRFFHDLFL